MESKFDNTVIIKAFSGRPVRAINNRFINEMESHRDHLLPFPAQLALTSTLRKASAEKLSPDFVSMWAGQGLAMVEELPAREIINNLVKDYKNLMQVIEHHGLNIKFPDRVQIFHDL